MRNKIIIGILLLLTGCDQGPPDQFKAGMWADCKLRWKDSGYEYRLSEPFKAYSNANILGYYCQVKVDGRWVNENNVKLGG